MYSSCIIGGCVKNCEQFIEPVFDNIIKIHKLFKKTKIVMSFDNSSDLTLKKLCEMKFKLEFKNKNSNSNDTYSNDINKNDNNEILMDIIINKDQITNSRTVNIEKARNKILDKIYNDNNYDDNNDDNNDDDNKDDYEYFIMIDMDDVSAKSINIEVLEKALKDNEQWDGLFFNNENYYDFWALSIGDFQYSCWHSYNVKRILNAMNRELHNRFKELKIINNSKDITNNTTNNKIDNGKTSNKYLECQSAFGGFGIYKTEKFKGCRYRSRIDLTFFNTQEMLEKFANIYKTLDTKYIISENIDDCEHRYFHMNAIKKNGVRLMISPEHLFPPYIGEHITHIEKIHD